MKSTEKELLLTEKQRLIALCEAFHKMNEPEKEEQLSELFLKVTKEEYAVAFCGHFSAGKSSLINALSNTGILPASPIPTSANIVKMKKGTPRAVVQLKSKEVVTFSYPYDVEEIKRFCKDSELVQAIEIYYESDETAADIAFYDTPGIDSTDPAHKEATENVIYLADLIFYVMDYNHILSETNVDFIKSLMDKGKSVRLIINQIDKHREEELTFKAFKANVYQSFKSYGIEREQIFFTSVKSPDLPYNDLSALIAYFKKIEMNKDSLLLNETNRQLSHFVSDFIQKEEAETFSLQSITEKLGALYPEKDKLQNQSKKMEEERKEKEESIKTHFVKIIESAQLMPYETREKAGLFIESAKKDFKVGMFFSKQKTEKERNQRSAAFQEKLQVSIDAHINWHAENYINTLQKELASELPEWEPVKLNADTLYSHVQTGLSSQGQGLLNYCESIAGEAKKLARQQMSHIIAAAVKLINDRNDETCRNIKNKEDQLHQEIAALISEKEKAIHWEQQKNNLLNILSNDTAGQFSVEDYEKKYKAQYSSISVEEFTKIFMNNQDADLPESGHFEETELQKTEVIEDHALKNETAKLYKAAELLRPLSGVDHLADEMDVLARRLENRSFSMVLFGAFSAGKSSFANALFGESILPSSPNPTTAAINEVRKPDQTHPHGTVIIEMKTEQEVLDEINNILETNSENLNLFMNELPEEKEINPGFGKSNRHIGAFIEGYHFAKKHISQSITTDLSEIEKYAAVEAHACYVKKITIYYSCPVTEKGLVLVDTPGANSIHSRHTEVAFEYMKHADIIIYLTYFNHAFSYADREFLIQLGRIKDTFSSDKMFFSINASDLAESEEDKRAVVDHVKENLQTFGIRNPRLFPVSSKNELMESGTTESGFSAFTNSLYEYVEKDLERVMILSAEMSQIHAKNVVASLIAEIKLRLQKEDDYLKGVQSREDFLLKQCDQHISLSRKQINQEMKELLFYVKQRVLIRFHDFYKETVHPAAVHSSKAELNECLDELYQKVAHDLHQEFRACSLRLDKWIQQHLKEKETILINKAMEDQVSLKVQDEDKDLYETPHIPSRFNDEAGKDKNAWLSYYKNGKQFFEQGGSNELKNDLAKRIESETETWMVSVNKVLEDHYMSLLERVERNSKTLLSGQITHYFAELKKPGDLEGRLADLQNCLDELERLTN